MFHPPAFISGFNDFAMVRKAVQHVRGHLILQTGNKADILTHLLLFYSVMSQKKSILIACYMSCPIVF